MFGDTCDRGNGTAGQATVPPGNQQERASFRGSTGGAAPRAGREVTRGAIHCFRPIYTAHTPTTHVLSGGFRGEHFPPSRRRIREVAEEVSVGRSLRKKYMWDRGAGRQLIRASKNMSAPSPNNTSPITRRKTGSGIRRRTGLLK